MKSEIALVLLLCAGFAAAQASSLDEPYFWDGLYYVAPSARDLYLDPGKGIPSGPWDNGHPPLLFWILAGAWLAAGPYLWVSHGVILAFALAVLALTWKAGRSLFGPRAGLLAALLLAAHPLFFYQTGMLTLDIPVAAFALAAFLAARSERFGAAAVAASAMVLTRETAIVFLPAIAAAALLLGDLPPHRRAWTRGAAFAIGVPSLVLAGWFVVHHAAAGWWFYAEASREVKLATPEHFSGFPYELYRRTMRPFLRDHGQWGLSLLCAAALLVALAKRRGSPAARSAWTLAGLCAGMVAPMGAVATLLLIYMPRYFLPAIPFFCILAGWAAARAGRAGPVLAGAALVPLLLAHHGPAIPGWESNRGHLRTIALNLEASRYLEERHPEARILARWPLWQQLCEPIYGYVTRPMKVVVLGKEPELEEMCAPGTFTHIPKSRVEHLRPEDFDLIWASPRDLEVDLYGFLERRMELEVAGQVEHDGMRVTLLAPGRSRAEPPGSL